MNKSIVIIGAGASGVAAASKLLSKGFENVTILEAEKRFGGRVNTVPFGANVVDMGAQWCHGEKNNVVYELAKDKNVLDRSIKPLVMSIKFIRSNGDQIPDELSKKLMKVMMNIYEGEDDNSKEKSAYHGSFGNYFAEKFEDALKADEFKEVDPELAHELFTLFHQQVNLIDGADSWYDTSSSPHNYEDCEGNRQLNWKDKGYVTVFDLLQNKIPSSEKSVDVISLVKFNKEAKKISYNQPNGLITIDCVDGSSFSADHVICTVSLGVLKERHMQLFDPLLPLWKCNSINGMMIGTVDKIYLEFEQPFWSADWEGFNALWRLPELKEIREDPTNGDWLEGVSGFYSFSNLQPNMLCGWICGPKARIMEQKTDEQVKAGAEKLLRLFLKQKTIPDAKAMIRSKWFSNPHFRGSYSNYTLESDALNASTDKLAEPIIDANGKPVVQFAGEATSSRHYSCVHGAVESGWREADRLIDLYKNN